MRRSYSTVFSVRVFVTLNCSIFVRRIRIWDGDTAIDHRKIGRFRVNGIMSVSVEILENNPFYETLLNLVN